MYTIYMKIINPLDNSEANASELLEHLEEMLDQYYYITSDIYFKFSTTP